MFGTKIQIGAVGLFILALHGSEALASVAADKSQILVRSEQWMTAMDRQDRAGLENITGNRYQLHLLYGDGRDVTSRKDWIDGAVKRRWRHHGYEGVNIVVRGDHAIMMSKLNFAPPAKGLLKPAVNTSGAVVDVWERQNGEWKVVGRYAGRWSFFEWLDRLFGFAVGGILFGLLGWLLGRGRRKRSTAL